MNARDIAEEVFVWFNPNLPDGCAELCRGRKVAVLRLMDCGKTFDDERKRGRIMAAKLLEFRWVK